MQNSTVMHQSLGQLIPNRNSLNFWCKIFDCPVTLDQAAVHLLTPLFNGLKMDKVFKSNT